MVTMASDRFLTVAEVADQLRVSTVTVLRWLRSGRLAGTRLPGRRAGWRIRPSDLEAFLREHGAPRDDE